MQYLAEPTAATLKGCGYALQPKPRETKQTRFFFFRRMFGLKLMFVFVWFYLSFLCFLFSLDI